MTTTSYDDLAAAQLNRQIRNTIVSLLGLDDTKINDALARLVGDAFVGVNEASALTGLSVANIYRRIKDDADPFPRPVRVDGRSLWLLTELQAWIRARVAAHRGQLVAA